MISCSTHNTICNNTLNNAHNILNKHVQRYLNPFSVHASSFNLEPQAKAASPKLDHSTELIKFISQKEKRRGKKEATKAGKEETWKKRRVT